MMLFAVVASLLVASGLAAWIWGIVKLLEAILEAILE